jgi:hypothetical protein
MLIDNRLEAQLTNGEDIARISIYDRLFEVGRETCSGAELHGR